MNIKLKTWRLAAALLAGCALPVGAAPLPASQTEVAIVARDQPIGNFIRDLFGRVGRPVVASPNLTGTINGSFNGPITKVFSDVAKAFNLVGYYDGAAIYIYAANELTVRTLPVGAGAAQRALRQVSAQRLADARNIARASPDGNLVVSGTPRFVEQVTALAEGTGGGGGAGGGLGGGGLPRLGYGDFDKPVPLEFRVFYLRYARAEDTSVTAGNQVTRVPGLASILRNLVLDQRPAATTSSSAPTFGARLVRQSQPRLGGQGLGAVSPDASQTPVLGYPTGNNVLPDAVLGGDVLGGDVAPVGSADTVRIEANPYLNALIVRDLPERMNSYDSLIRALDVEPQLVEVEVTIIDINTEKLRKLGINWRLSTGGFGALFGDGENDTRLLPTTTSRRDNVNNITPSALGGTISTIIGNQRQFLARITALETQDAARVVSRPQLMTLSNVEAIFDRTQTFYVRVAGRQQVDLFNVTAGTLLRVNPHVFRDHDQTRIRVLVNVEDGSLQPETVDNIPLVEKTSVATQAMVVDGESLLLGGMTVDQSVNGEYRVPILGQIPLLGELFKFRSRQRAHTERLFLITPRVATLGTGAGAARALSAASDLIAPAVPTTSAVPSAVPPATPTPRRP